MKRCLLTLMCAPCLLAAHPTGLKGVVSAEPEVAVVATPPREGQNQHYVGNRPPLLPNPLVKLPIGSIRPGGWLRGQLVLESNGFLGRLREISPWCNPDGSAWMSPAGQGRFGWEELPYWLKGFGDLGYVLGDERIIREARVWIDAVLASQQPDGWFGPLSNRTPADGKPDLWPNMIMLNVLQSFHEATGDERVIPFMTRYFRWELGLPEADLLPGSWQKVRAGDNIESVYWLYNRTGEAWLLDLARRLHARTARWDEGIASWHGVNFCQGFREPAVYFMLSRDPRHLEATERNYRAMMAKYGQMPGGMFAADENCRPGFDTPRQGAESCSMVEFMHSDQMLCKFTGDPEYADRCEEIAFNSFPACMTPDAKGLHYITAPNQVQLDRNNKAPGTDNRGELYSYNPHTYRCCQHNIAMGWPYYAEHLWCATRDNGLAAVLYGESEVRAKVGNGATVTIRQRGGYPFEETVTLAVSAAGTTRFPLYLRVPRWCEGARVSLNGSPLPVAARPRTYVRIERAWADGDEVRLDLPMRITIRRWKAQENAVSVDRGPLTYSLKIGEKWVRYGGTDAWPAFEVFPTTPWNYGLILDDRDPAASFQVVRKTGGVPEQPFATEAAPIELLARGRRIPNWTLDEFGLVGLLQPSPVRSDQPIETITLIPMGAARLRISVFPTIGEGPEAREWQPQEPLVQASPGHQGLHAICDGEVPRGDRKADRLTWPDRRGTREWVIRSFGKPRRVTACEIWWADDETTGGPCRAPAGWKLYRRQDREWHEVKGVPAGEARGRPASRVTFEPVITDAMKLEIQWQEGFPGGLYEWKFDLP